MNWAVLFINMGMLIDFKFVVIHELSKEKSLLVSVSNIEIAGVIIKNSMRLRGNYRRPSLKFKGFFHSSIDKR